MFAKEIFLIISLALLAFTFADDIEKKDVKLEMSEEAPDPVQLEIPVVQNEHGNRQHASQHYHHHAHSSGGKHHHHPNNKHRFEDDIEEVKGKSGRIVIGVPQIFDKHVQTTNRPHSRPRPPAEHYHHYHYHRPNTHDDKHKDKDHNKDKQTGHDKDKDRDRWDYDRWDYDHWDGDRWDDDRWKPGHGSHNRPPWGRPPWPGKPPNWSHNTDNDDADEDRSKWLLWLYLNSLNRPSHYHSGRPPNHHRPDYHPPSHHHSYNYPPYYPPWLIAGTEGSGESY